MRPDVAVVDVHLPNGGGGEVIERARRTARRGVLALSVSDAADDVVGVIRAGARGYVTKTIDADQLVDAIRRVHTGDECSRPAWRVSSWTRSIRRAGPRPSTRRSTSCRTASRR